MVSLFVLPLQNEPLHGKTNNGENKGSDQLQSYCEADQRLCFCYTDSTIPLLSKSKISSSNHLLCLYGPVCVGPGPNPKCWFSHAQAQIND